MKIKILHVTQSLGGVKTYLENIFNYSDDNDFQYIIAAPEHAELQRLCKSKFVTYYPIKIRRSINPVVDVAALIKIITIIKFEQPDIVHTHSAKGGFLGRIAAKIMGIKAVYSPHAFSYLSFKGVKRIIFYMLEFFAKKLTDILLAVSYSEANRAIYELDYTANQVKTILNAVTVNETLPFRNYKSNQRIGMIGRLTYQKNPLLFLEIAASLIKKNPFLQFSILGAGLTDHLSREIEGFLTINNLHKNVNILNWGDNETSKRFFNEIDIFVLTSVFEGLPFSLIEAMSLGIPCVVSKVDGNTDVIQNGENGYSCLTMSEFKQKIELLLDSEELRRKIGQAGHRYVHETHEIHKNLQMLEDLYSKLYYSAGLRSIKRGKNDTQEQLHLKTSPGI